MTKLLSLGLIVVLLGWAAPIGSAEIMEQGKRLKGRSYSPAIVTEGGRIIWLAGETTTTDLEGNDIRGDFEAQARTVFALIDQTLNRTGSSLKDIVQMTVYLTDARNGPTFSMVRKELYPAGRYPTSAQVTVSNLAIPGMLIEIQAVAVIGENCSDDHPCLPK